MVQSYIFKTGLNLKRCSLVVGCSSLTNYTFSCPNQLHFIYHRILPEILKPLLGVAKTSQNNNNKVFLKVNAMKHFDNIKNDLPFYFRNHLCVEVLCCTALYRTVLYCTILELKNGLRSKCLIYKRNPSFQVNIKRRKKTFSGRFKHPCQSKLKNVVKKCRFNFFQ